MKSACFRRLTPLLLLARGAMLRATHVASVSRQDCRALFAKLSDVEHQLEPCDDGRRAAVRLKRDSNTVPGPECPAGAGRGEHQASRGPWVVGGDVGRWGRAGWRTRGRCVAHTRAMRGVGGRVRVGPPAGAHRVGGQALCGSGAWRAPLLTRAFSIPSRARACLDCRGGEAKHAGRVDGGGRGGEGGRGEGAEATAAERASGRRRGRSARVGRRRGGR